MPAFEGYIKHRIDKISVFSFNSMAESGSEAKMDSSQNTPRLKSPNKEAEVVGDSRWTSAARAARKNARAIGQW